jgi:molybdopterin-guanine dinucleotide biosynthesis protein A
MLLLNLALLRYMILLSADYHMVVPRLGGNPEPLHAVYSRACVRPLERALSRGDQGISAILAGLRVRYVEDSEVETFDVNHLSFSRVRSGHDWEWAQKQLQRRKR